MERFFIESGDITKTMADAIVNAANSYLQHGGGVAGAIARKGGPAIQQESDAIGYVPVGGCASTTGGRLKASFVIHAVGPRWGEGNEEAKLRSAVRSTLALAEEKRFRTISMPAISAGIFGFPKDRCARIMLEEVLAFAKASPTTLEEVSFCLMDEEIITHFVRHADSMRDTSE